MGETDIFTRVPENAFYFRVKKQFKFAHGKTVSLHPLFGVETGGLKLEGENAWVKIGG